MPSSETCTPGTSRSSDAIDIGAACSIASLEITVIEAGLRITSVGRPVPMTVTVSSSRASVWAIAGAVAAAQQPMCRARARREQDEGRRGGRDKGLSRAPSTRCGKGGVRELVPGVAGAAAGQGMRVSMDIEGRYARVLISRS